jgi:hypothetical protein
MNVKNPDPETYSGLEAEVSKGKVRVRMSEGVAIILIPSLVFAGLIWVWYQANITPSDNQQSQLLQPQKRTSKE